MQSILPQRMALIGNKLTTLPQPTNRESNSNTQPLPAASASHSPPQILETAQRLSMDTTGSTHRELGNSHLTPQYVT